MSENGIVPVPSGEPKMPLWFKVRLLWVLFKPYIVTFVSSFVAFDLLVYWLADMAYNSVNYVGHTFYPNPERFVDSWFTGLFFIVAAAFFLLIVLRYLFDGGLPLDDSAVFFTCVLFAVLALSALRYFSPMFLNALPNWLGIDLAQLEQVFHEGTKTHASDGSTFMA